MLEPKPEPNLLVPAPQPWMMVAGDPPRLNANMGFLNFFCSYRQFHKQLKK